MSGGSIRRGRAEEDGTKVQERVDAIVDMVVHVVVRPACSIIEAIGVVNAAAGFEVRRGGHCGRPASGGM